MYRKAPGKAHRENASRESAAGQVGAGHTKQRRDLGGTEAGGAGSTVQSAGVTGGPSEATARQGRAGQGSPVTRGGANKVSRAPERLVRVAVCRLGCGVVGWRCAGLVAAQVGWRRTQVRVPVVGGGVQRRLGVWRCSAGWGGGAARRTARVSRGVWRWQQFFTSTRDVAEFAFFRPFCFTATHDVADFAFFRPFCFTATHDVADFAFFRPFYFTLQLTTSRILVFFTVTSLQLTVPRRRELQ